MHGSDVIEELSNSYQDLFRSQNVIMTFEDFLSAVQKDPRRYIRNAADYIMAVFDHFGSRPLDPENEHSLLRYEMFDVGTERNGPIIGGEAVHRELRNIISNFSRQGFSSKLILLHGPNGSSKTSTVETLGRAMQLYSETDEGAVYRFNWVFPSDKSAGPTRKGEAGPIGFGLDEDKKQGKGKSYATLHDSRISSRISSEFKENPIFLIPNAMRIELLRKWLSEKEGIPPEEVALPHHVTLPGLSKRNQAIFESLLNAYDGNLSEVFRHVQVERFFYSRQYHVGNSTVEPQMSIDAREKQLTIDKNISNLPPVLSTISFFISEGEIVEANRGILEFSDLLKRPVEAYKYLLSTIEKASINLPSGSANLDIVFLGTTNEKHLDAFKTTPDFASFKGRMELVTVPYLLRPSLEMKIYDKDIEALGKTQKVAPHTLRMLATWAVMTRYKQPEPEAFEKGVRSLIAKIDPRSKAKLYDEEPLGPDFSAGQQAILQTLRSSIMNESVGMVVYEGRFGASPREVRVILHRAAQNSKYETLTPVSIFEELRSLTKDRTVFEFLQFEPRGEFHNASAFIDTLEGEFSELFEKELVASMNLIEVQEYEVLLRRYIDHVVAQIKKERIWDETTGSYIEPSAHIMNDVEKILEIKEAPGKYREALLSRIASFRIENPDKELDIMVVFSDMLSKIQNHFYQEKRTVIDSNCQLLLQLDKEDANLSSQEIAKAEEIYRELESRFNYDRESALTCLKFALRRKTKKS